MHGKNWDVWVVLSLAGLLAASLGLQAGAAWVGKVVPRDSAQLNETRIEVETTLYAGDRVSTTEGSLALIELPRGSQIYVGPNSAVLVEPDKEGEEVVADLNQGTLVARSRPGSPVSVWAANLWMHPSSSEAVYQVELVDQGAIVAARRGAVRVEGANRAVSVPAGESLRFEVAPAAAEQGNKQEGRRRPKGNYAQSALSRGQKAAIIVGIGAAVATAIALPLALDDDQQKVVSPATP